MKHLVVILFTLLALIPNLNAQQNDPIVFNDQPLTEAISNPDWFNLSFLDLSDDLAEANNSNRGLIIYYSQSYCPYCKAFLKNNWQQKDIIAYTQKNFDVISINVLGNKKVTNFDGKVYSEKQYSILQKTHFTPSLVFYDNQGKRALLINGYRPPYQFRAALEFVSGGHHLQENFRQYLARADAAMNIGQDKLNKNQIFLKPPYNLAAQIANSSRHNLVIFERLKCHSCDILHAGPLASKQTLKLLSDFNVIQLDMWSKTKITTYQGKTTTAMDWANQLNLDYAPSLLFYDNKGIEVMRVDSVVGLFRLQGVLKYISSKGYLKYSTYQQWKYQQTKK